MKIRSIDQLENYLNAELSWRQKELAHFEKLILSSRKAIKTTLIKTGVVLLYSHWEGFVKTAAIAFCEYINSKGIPYKDLTVNFRVNAVLNHFKSQQSNANFYSILKIIDGRSIDLNQSCAINTAQYIDTKSNLKSKVFKEIVAKIGVDYKNYETKARIIDSKLLHFRNKVSHGESIEIEESDFNDLLKEIRPMMIEFKSQISNSVTRKSYLASRNSL